MSGGGTLFFPSGEYKVTKTIRFVNHGIEITGEQAVNTLIKPSNNFIGDTVFDFTFRGSETEWNWSYIRNIKIHDLGFLGKDSSTLANPPDMIRMDKVYDLNTIENLYFEDIFSTAIKLINTIGATPTETVGQGTIIQNLMIINKAESLSTATKPLISLENQNECYINTIKILAGDKGWTDYPKRTGLKLAGCQGITVQSNSFSIMSAPAITVTFATTNYQTQCKGVFLESNTFEDITSQAISVLGGPNSTTESGEIRYNKMENIIISENRHYGLKTEYPITVNYSTDVVIRDNIAVTIGKDANKTLIYNNQIQNIIDNGIATTVFGAYDDGISRSWTTQSDLLVNKINPGITLQEKAVNQKFVFKTGYRGSPKYGFDLKHIHSTGEEASILAWKDIVLSTDFLFKLNPRTVLPAAKEDKQGSLCFIKADATKGETKDSLYICMQDGGIGVYKWNKLI
ncbi:right-handed parallel beta-helix repeat-containing protein [Listeria booriae]|uniref:Right-handed parallel beta-helix repeat-containing protein n=1 Tax=Listeria booriae TaxID=1552123 RepID=A0A7X1CCU6_9LIST|nr:right-handed parallel beta-helix repeat-containing protein [Listeria booriae]MBC1492826.1 right-handed parallel beta-helix repeat-containing protein [Listeria booriae]MBC1504095.1 right-handed parallel beta-helix repeat-containing protein [Listeria booriae]